MYHTLHLLTGFSIHLIPQLISICLDFEFFAKDVLKPIFRTTCFSVKPIPIQIQYQTNVFTLMLSLFCTSSSLTGKE